MPEYGYHPANAWIAGKENPRQLEATGGALPNLRPETRGYY